MHWRKLFQNTPLNICSEEACYRNFCSNWSFRSWPCQIILRLHSHYRLDLDQLGHTRDLIQIKLILIKLILIKFAFTLGPGCSGSSWSTWHLTVLTNNLDQYLVWTQLFPDQLGPSGKAKLIWINLIHVKSVVWTLPKYSQLSSIMRKHVTSKDFNFFFPSSAMQSD